MKKSSFVLYILAVISTPLIILSVCHFMTIRPQVYKSITELPEASEEEVISQIVVSEKTKPSQIFLSGYYDGWRGKAVGPIRWIVNEDYRQGHMLGVYDRKKGVDRYKE